jgi:hypothetical protein
MRSKTKGIDVVTLIKKKFNHKGDVAIIPLQRGGNFKARLVDGGIEVDNLGNQPFLPWRVFQEAIVILMQNKGSAKRGDAMNSKLGEKGLPLNSVEGHIASEVYGKQVGDSVFRRITPIACILEWAGVCKSEPGKLILLKENN